MNFGFRIADFGSGKPGGSSRPPSPAATSSLQHGDPGTASARIQSAFRNPQSALVRRLAVLACLAAASSPATAELLTLDEAIRLALQRNQELKVSAFSPDIARANVLAEYGRFDPAFTFERHYSQSEQVGSTTPLRPPVSQADEYALSFGGSTPWGLRYSLEGTANNRRTPANGFTDTYVTFGGVSITQPLLRGFGFGANLASLRIAKADRGIADWQHRQTVIDTVTSVALVYTNVLLARENVRIFQFSRELSARLVSQYEKRNAAGAISDADVLFARARLASREENVLIGQRNATDAENLLRQLIGESNYFVTGSALELEPLVPAPPVTVDPANELKRAYVLRPDFQAAKLGVSRRRYTSTLAQNQLLPRVDFVGSYGYNGIDGDFGAARAQVRDRDARAYSAGLVVSIPLTFAEGRGRARAAKLSLKQSEADLVRLEQDIAIDVAAAAGQIETTRLRVQAARRAMEVAQQSLSAEQKKLDAGTIFRPLDLVSAQEQLAQTQSSYARAVAAEHQARANYERALGITLETRGIKLE